LWLMTRFVVHSIVNTPTYHHDQSINVVECREFRDLLLLLRESLKETDIPHRTKLREEIIKAWKGWFQILKDDLEVRISVYWTYADLTRIPESCRKNKLYCRYLV
jgi:hypothetical protein